MRPLTIQHDYKALFRISDFGFRAFFRRTLFFFSIQHIVLLAVILLPAVAASPAERENGSEIPKRCISADEQFDFAQTYFDRGEFDRAAAEYERFVHFFPDDPRVGAARFHIGRSYYELGEYAKAEERFEYLIQEYEGSDFALDAHFELSNVYLKRNDPRSAVQILERVTKTAEKSAIRDRAWHGMAWIFIEYAEWEPALAALHRISPANQPVFGVPTLVERLERADHIPRKNPKLAAAVSIIPGGGYVYCNRYRDALTAFLLNGGMIWAAVSAFENGNPALGGVIAFVEAGFYGGNIYGGINCANKFNRRQTLNFIEELKQGHRIRISLDMTSEKYGMLFETAF
ncbi:MAG: tetratricopeptide repeat protein [Desulfobacterales bacterium]